MHAQMPSDAILRRRPKLPLWPKVVFTLFLCVLVPKYWPIYGPADFLWFCDVAAFLTLVALWLESPLLAGANAVGMTLAQTIWILDFVSGGHLIGISAYMFDEIEGRAIHSCQPRITDERVRCMGAREFASE